jgi:hypothetical protein
MKAVLRIAKGYEICIRERRWSCSYEQKQRAVERKNLTSGRCKAAIMTSGACMLIQ